MQSNRIGNGEQDLKRLNARLATRGSEVVVLVHHVFGSIWLVEDDFHSEAKPSHLGRNTLHFTLHATSGAFQLEVAVGFTLPLMFQFSLCHRISLGEV